MPQAVAIVGTGQTQHCTRRKDANAPEMIHEAVTRALENAGMTLKDIDAIVIGNMEHFEGINYSDQWCIEGAGGYLKPYMKVATGGTTGSSVGLAAFYQVASGVYDTVLAIGWEKLSDSEGETTTGIVTAFDPIYERPTMAGAISGLAIGATSFMNTYGITPEQAALASVKSRRNAAKNPYAHLRTPVTVEEVVNSMMLSYPIRLLDMCPTSDGACAVIFSNASKAKKARGIPAWVKGAASVHNYAYLGEALSFIPPFSRWSLTEAAKKVYAQAGVTNPRRDIDVAEIYEPSAWSELQWYALLGFADPSEVGKFMESGATEIGGELPVNPSGGVISTNPIGATGLIRIAEAALQLRGEGGERQVEGARRALTTGFGGSNWNEVMFLERS